MYRLRSTLLAALFGSASFMGIAYTQAFHPTSGQTGLLSSGAALALADEDGFDDQGDRGDHGGQSCINPAGHVRGWCKHGNRQGNYRGGNYTTISGTVIAENGDLVQFREDNGATITINQSNLLNAGTALSIGGHYTLRGFWSNNMFVAQANGGYYGGNGYPSGANASVHGVITSVSGNRVTILQGLFSTITIDDQQALNRGQAQNLYVGRSITAYGYWSGNTFFATSIG